MQKKKIFIEIAIPSQIGRRLSQKVAKWQDLPVKWIKENNLHLTVAFIGYVDESVLPDICARVSQAVQDMESFDIVLEKIELGPDPENPRMVWATGRASEQLKQLHERVEEALNMRPEHHKEFRPHLTLGRIRKLKWEKLAAKPVIEEKINLVVPIDTVSVMESRGGGAEYVPLEECPLA
ncbi:MAG TPA: RNA 2',3'-cyclic phosphodiesterase [Patescibacteria group bacterium]